MQPYKFSIVVPRHLKMSPGKMASQVAHVASLVGESWSGSKEWEEYQKRPTKYVLSAGNAAELYQIMANAERSRCFVQPFMDSPPTTMNTEFTITAVAIFGPNAKVTKATAGLKLY